MKVNLFVANGKVYKTTYTKVKGEFSPTKLKQLKKFISVYKENLLYAWQQFFDYNVSLKKIIITKKLK